MKRDDRSIDKPVRVLFSFPHKLGGPRICGIAWHQVDGLIGAGADVVAWPGVYSKRMSVPLTVRPTLSRGRLRIPYKLVGRLGACKLHDYIVARRLEKLGGQIDIVHAWPLGALQTLKTAAKMGIPTVLERCNAHTRFAYEVVQAECDKLGVPLPPDHEHFYNKELLAREEHEYEAADRLLCPSDFVVDTFVDQGFKREKLLRHIYGFDEKVYHANGATPNRRDGLKMLFVGVCAVRKGVHYALEAWLRSSAAQRGTFQIAGEFLPAYAERLASSLSHPTVKVLGHRNDIPELMRQSDVLVLPSIEEGFGLVVAEAMGSGCVPLVSEACTDICKHMENGLVHKVGDVTALAEHLTLLDQNRDLLERLRSGSLRDSRDATWRAAGVRLLGAYKQALGHTAITPKCDERSLQNPVPARG